MANAKLVLLIRMIAVAVAPPALPAQQDFRSVDPGRPIRLEDAYPIEYLAWEWEIGTEARLAEGARGVTGSIELKVGVARNWQMGIEVRPAWDDVAGSSSGGVEEFGAHLLFNLKQEGRTVPALAFRGDLIAPGAGAVGRENFGGKLLALATMSFGGARVHANGGYAIASETDGGGYRIAALGFDVPVGFFSKSILGDVYWEVPAGGAAARVWAEVGARLQISNSRVVNLGIAGRMDEWADGTANVAVVVGLSRSFGIPGLVRVPTYPRPRLN